MSPSTSPRPAPIELPSPATPAAATSSPAPEPTNTLALLLPHPFLFHPPILSLLRSHYESFGSIHTFAPIRAFGRVIIVYHEDEGAMRAKREGDHLEIGGGEEQGASQASSAGERQQGGAAAAQETTRTYFSGQDGAGTHPRLTLRLYLAARTDLVPSSSDHLEPPPLTKNFLISPPGSPPEGWEPILEDPPNSNTLAADLTRALEALAVQAPLRRGEKTTLIDNDDVDQPHGPSVTVQDMTPDLAPGDDGGVPDEIFESEAGRQQAFKISQVKATVDSMGGGERTPGGSLFGGYADAFVAGGVKIVPTPMPPR